jgi:hypothetical protein
MYVFQWQPVTQLTTPQQMKVSMDDIETIGASIAVPMVINQNQIA